jgi:hypothetical protein
MREVRRTHFGGCVGWNRKLVGGSPRRSTMAVRGGSCPPARGLPSVGFGRPVRGIRRGGRGLAAGARDLILAACVGSV